MDFGKLTAISEVNFTLPPDNIFTEEILGKTNLQHKKPAIYVGPPVWANKDWIGKIYPTNAKDSDFLYHYSRQFNTIELNVTHYQIPSEVTIEKWKNAVPNDFKFCPKFPQIISHDKKLLGTDSLTEEFCRNVLLLEDKLGTTFLQLSPTFETKHLTSLENFLLKLPLNFPIAVEFRHESWFKNQIIWQKTAEMLANLGVGTVMTDVAGRRDVLHQTLTNSTFVLRFVGNELHKTDYERVNAWCEHLKNWLEKGLQTAYIFVHCGENILAPELTKYWIEQLNKLGDFNLAPPKFREKVVQGSLF